MMSFLLLKGCPFLYKGPIDMTGDEDLRQLIKDKSAALAKKLEKPQFAQAAPIRNIKANLASPVCEMF
jgi:protein-arginine kinase activator protein McsA